MNIRIETEYDRSSVNTVNESAFGGLEEVAVIERLRGNESLLFSLVVEADHQIVAHVVFSTVELTGHSDLALAALGPMAVLPTYQRQGVGTKLIRAGLERCRDCGIGAVFVLGHPTYYPRFGFVPSTRFDIGCEFEVPDEAFMVLQLKPGYLTGKAGKISYAGAFSDA